MASKTATAEKVEFNYEGTNRGGAKVKGAIFALSDTLAKNELRKQGINPIKVKKKPKDLFGGAKKPDAADIAIFARQIATMMKAGVPLVQSFEIIGEGNEKPMMQKLILGIKSEVEGASRWPSPCPSIHCISINCLSTWSMPVNNRARWKPCSTSWQLIRKRLKH